MKHTVLICLVFIALILKLAPENSGASAAKNKQVSAIGIATDTAIADQKDVSLPKKTATVSFYGKGDGFHGKTTANGEKFNTFDLTAAHRSLPFGTIVRIVNPGNGKEVYVRINDRGPYVGNRKFDLSYAAANKLGIVTSGIASVRYEIVRI